MAPRREVGAAVDAEAALMLPKRHAHRFKREEVAVHGAANDSAVLHQIADAQAAGGINAPMLDAAQAGGLAPDPVGIRRGCDPNG